MTYLSILDYAGNLAFIVSCILAVREVTKDRWVWLTAAVLPTFIEIFFICDLASLRTKQFILYSLHKIALTLSIALVMSSVLSYKKASSKRESYIATKISVILKIVLLIADSLGVLASVSIGYERSLSMGGSLLVAIMCGWVTAMGRGIFARIIASILAHIPFSQKLQWLNRELKRNIPYYSFGLIITLAYSLISTAIGKTLVIIVITAPTIAMGIFINKEMSARN